MNIKYFGLTLTFSCLFGGFSAAGESAIDLASGRIEEITLGKAYAPPSCHATSSITTASFHSNRDITSKAVVPICDNHKFLCLNARSDNEIFILLLDNENSKL